VNERRVRFLGNLSQERLARYYVLCNATVHISWIDWCPNVVVESISSGTPVVCNNVGGNPEIVGRSGIICKLDRPYPKGRLNPRKPPQIPLPSLVHGYERVVTEQLDCFRPDLDIASIALKYLDAFTEVCDAGG
jgi:glycosyltransferase involved in cell wall biosynthesis